MFTGWTTTQPRHHMSEATAFGWLFRAEHGSRTCVWHLWRSLRKEVDEVPS